MLMLTALLRASVRDFHDRLKSAAIVDPVAGPLAGVADCLRFVLEVVKGMKLIAIAFACAAVTFKQQIGREQSVRQTMCESYDFVAVILRNFRVMV
ncbi:hypothetical protein [Caballeronia sp. M23-90]